MRGVGELVPRPVEVRRRVFAPAGQELRGDGRDRSGVPPARRIVVRRRAAQHHGRRHGGVVDPDHVRGERAVVGTGGVQSDEGLQDGDEDRCGVGGREIE